MIVTIDFRFTTLNEYILAERTHYRKAAAIKKSETEVARLAVLNKHAVSMYPLDVVCRWFRVNERTDPDNIAFGIKFILDGFVDAGVIAGDAWKHIRSIRHEFHTASYDYVVVELS